MPAIAIPKFILDQERRYIDHTGRVRAVTRALVQDIDQLCREVPDLAPWLRHDIARNRRRATQLLRERI